MTETVSITWWGHSTVTITIGGHRVLTDPVLTRRVAHLSRIGVPVPGAEAAQADVAVVSHLHLDHLHVPSLRKLGREVRLVAPRGTARALGRGAPDLARRVEEVGPGDVVDLGGVTIRAVPAEHDGRRSPMSRDRGPALGYVLEGDGADPGTVWFAGDTGLFDTMDEIGPVDLALVPVSGWGPTLGPTHLDPVQAAEAVRRVGAGDAVPIHYGTLWPTGLRHVHRASFQRRFRDPAVRFRAALAAVSPGSEAHVIAPGQTVVIQG